MVKSNFEHIQLGRHCETMAAEFLLKHGYQLLERNWRNRRGEVDLILKKQGFIIFAEVKHIGKTGLFSLERLINSMKRNKIILTARYYLLIHPECRNLLIRFDVLAIDADKNKVTHFKNAFGETAFI